MRHRACSRTLASLARANVVSSTHGVRNATLAPTSECQCAREVLSTREHSRNPGSPPARITSGTPDHGAVAMRAAAIAIALGAVLATPAATAGQGPQVIRFDG